MSNTLINHNEDLSSLRDEGLEIDIVEQFLIVRNVPYLDSGGNLNWGTLVSELTLAGDSTTTPSKHTVMFDGEFPCSKNGEPLLQLKHKTEHKQIAPGLVIEHMFSNKPKEGYSDYYHKMWTYYTIIAGPAQSKFPEEASKPPSILQKPTAESVFEYLETSSSRAGINLVTRKLNGHRIAIIGLGGTGGYILDLIAKTPVKEIHLFDGDEFLQHNAFRAPGAADKKLLSKKPMKVDYFHDVYSKMHRGIVSHGNYINDANIKILSEMDFVFLCIDNSGIRKSIAEFLIDSEVPFIDVGMGIGEVDNALHGVVRVTTCTPSQNKHFERRAPLNEFADDNVYSSNIQVADLNMFNASIAVIRWKKYLSFYHDFEGEHHSAFTIDGNIIQNSDKRDK